MEKFLDKQHVKCNTTNIIYEYYEMKKEYRI